ncbi:MAG: hypothetical protein G3M70_14935 [Candidatus Nitronauta litoralis]|uniref:Tetratricopeptide repeat protein n=1 Tax=Candidatus Nitronauta litoralis TaxID=2705533 RepID=A0A7T0BY66_9BACT|nr:MAG: hypothetical protein G3M70_14935 [Candidatus Nitronauta litoralis]
MPREQTVSVEQVREAQELFKNGMDLHQEKKFKEAIELFKSCASVNPEDASHLGELTKKLKSGSYKLDQESIAYMGCSAVHLNSLVAELTEEEKEEVPIEQSLLEAFNSWH